LIGKRHIAAVIQYQLSFADRVHEFDASDEYDATCAVIREE
jgi:hypothetical protein